MVYLFNDISRLHKIKKAQVDQEKRLKYRLSFATRMFFSISTLRPQFVMSKHNFFSEDFVSTRDSLKTRLLHRTKLEVEKKPGARKNEFGPIDMMG